MSDIRASLSSDNTIKAILNTDHNLKAVVSQGVTINQTVNGGNSVHFVVPVSANNQQFTSDDLVQYASNLTVNLLKNGVFLTAEYFVKLTSNTIQVNTFLNAGDTLDVLATGSATIGVGAGYGIPGGLYNQIQYNYNGNFAGDGNFTFDVANGTANLHKINSANIATDGITANVGNIKELTITGNATIANIVLTDQLVAPNISTPGDIIAGGNINANVVNANTLNIPGSLSFANATVTGTITSNTIVSNNAILGSASNVIITGGTNGYVLQTDGTGNLSWTAQTGGGGGGGIPGGADTQVQYNDGGIFGGSSTFTFNKDSSILSASYIAGALTTGNQPNISNVGTLGNLTVTTNITSGNITANLKGDGGNVSNIRAGNIVGTVANATYATTSGTTISVTAANIVGTVANANYSANAGFANVADTVANSTQSNITTVGTLLNLNVAGTATASGMTAATFTGNLSGTATLAQQVTQSSQPNINSVGSLLNLTVLGNINASNIIGSHSGSGAGLTNLPGANVTGTVGNATYATSAGSATTATSATSATSATTAGTVTTAAQPNITSVGTLGNVYVSGTATLVTVRTDNLQYSNGTTIPIGGNYSNSNVASYLPTYTGNLAGANIAISNIATLGAVRTDNLQYANGANWQIGTVYSNSNVASYLPTYTGNLAGNNISISNIANLNTVRTDNLQYANGVTIPIGGTYSNTNVQNYLPTYTGSMGNLYVITPTRIQMKQFSETYAITANASGTLTPDISLGSMFKYTLTGNITLNEFINGTAFSLVGTSITVILVQDGTGGKTLTSTMKFANGSRTLSTAAGAIDILSILCVSSGEFYAALSKGYS